MKNIYDNYYFYNSHNEKINFNDYHNHLPQKTITLMIEKIIEFEKEIKKIL